MPIWSPKPGRPLLAGGRSAGHRLVRPLDSGTSHRSPTTDLDCGHDAAVARPEREKLAVLATGEQPLRRRLDHQHVRRNALRHRPTRIRRVLAHVAVNQLQAVGNIDEGLALPLGNDFFPAAAQPDIGGLSTRCRVDKRQAVAVAIGDKHGMCRREVGDRVTVAIGRDGINHVERLRFEYAQPTGLAIVGEVHAERVQAIRRQAGAQPVAVNAVPTPGAAAGPAGRGWFDLANHRRKRSV